MKLSESRDITERTGYDSIQIVIEENKLFQMPEPAETRRNLTGEAVRGKIQVPEIWDFGERTGDGTREPVLGKVQVLKMLAIGDVAAKRGVDAVVVQGQKREERQATE